MFEYGIESLCWGVDLFDIEMEFEVIFLSIECDLGTSNREVV